MSSSDDDDAEDSDDAVVVEPDRGLEEDAVDIASDESSEDDSDTDDGSRQSTSGAPVPNVHREVKQTGTGYVVGYFYFFPIYRRISLMMD